MRRILLVAVLALTALAVTQSAMAAPVGSGGSVLEFDQPATKGFFRGKTVGYLDFGPISLAAGNKIAPIWAFTNGTSAQRNVIDTVPGMRSYSPLWRVTMLTWKPGVAKRTLKSAKAIRAAIRAGDLRVKRTTTVVNCPVLGFGQQKIMGFFQGQRVEYLDLGVVKLKGTNKVAPIWAVTNGTDEQRNIIDTVPGMDDYTPLWQVVMVTWKDGVTPRTLMSRSDVEAAMAAGEVTLEQTQTVVNCPVV